MAIAEWEATALDSIDHPPKNRPDSPPPSFNADAFAYGLACGLVQLQRNLAELQITLAQTTRDMRWWPSEFAYWTTRGLDRLAGKQHRGRPRRSVSTLRRQLVLDITRRWRARVQEGRWRGTPIPRLSRTAVAIELGITPDALEQRHKRARWTWEELLTTVERELRHPQDEGHKNSTGRQKL